MPVFTTACSGTINRYEERAIKVGDAPAETKVNEEIEELDKKLKHAKEKMETINRLKELGIDIEILKEVLVQ